MSGVPRFAQREPSQLTNASDRMEISTRATATRCVEREINIRVRSSWRPKHRSALPVPARPRTAPGPGPCRGGASGPTMPAGEPAREPWTEIGGAVGRAVRSGRRPRLGRPGLQLRIRLASGRILPGGPGLRFHRSPVLLDVHLLGGEDRLQLARLGPLRPGMQGRGELRMRRERVQLFRPRDRGLAGVHLGQQRDREIRQVHSLRQWNQRGDDPLRLPLSGGPGVPCRSDLLACIRPGHERARRAGVEAQRLCQVRFALPRPYWRLNAPEGRR